jgi:hypothetical protein
MLTTTGEKMAARTPKEGAMSKAEVQQVKENPQSLKTARKQQGDTRTRANDGCGNCR